LISDSIIQSSLGHPVDFGDYAALAWVATSISTIIGALGGDLDFHDHRRPGFGAG
jgi:uncharacterized membrane protein YbhN (UPF0104 family)